MPFVMPDHDEPRNRGFRRCLGLLAVLAATGAPALHAQGGPTASVSPGSSTLTTASVTVTVSWCSAVMFDETSRQFTLDGDDVGGSFSTVNAGISGCAFGQRSTGTIVLPQTNNGVHVFGAAVEDVNGYRGEAHATYTYHWPNSSPASYRFTIVPLDGTQYAQPGTSGATQFRLRNDGSRLLTLSLAAHCARGASACSASPASVSVDTGAVATVTVASQLGTAGDTGVVTLLASMTVPITYGSEVRADSATTEIVIATPPPAASPGVVNAGAGSTIARDRCLVLGAGGASARRHAARGRAAARPRRHLRQHQRRHLHLVMVRQRLGRAG